MPKGYPPVVQRLFAWYDGLTDRERVQYAIVAMLFLLACGGYLLGLGSTLLLQRVEAQDAMLPLVAPTPSSQPTPREVAVVATPEPTGTPLQPTHGPPSAEPSPGNRTPTPFALAQIAEPRVQPRVIARPQVAPVAPVSQRPTPMAAKPRNLEDTTPESPAASFATPARADAQALVVASTAPTRPPTPGPAPPTAAPAPTAPPTRVPTEGPVSTPTNRPLTPQPAR